MNLDNLNTILLYGITFGIVIMTIVYTFIRYIYSKEIFYISYCLMQVFSLSYIVTYSSLFDIPHFVEQISLLLATLLALVFAINFYEGRFIPKVANYKELIINTLLLNVVILTAFYHYVLFEYLPFTIIYAILFISVIFNIKNVGPTLIYTIGWSFLCFTLFVFDFKDFYEQEGFLDIVLLAFAIEAILFTFSVSHRYNRLEQKNENFENMLLQQSKMAKSGEMLANIAHQFRQPLNNLSYILINLKTKFEKQKLTEEYFYKKYSQAKEQLEFLSHTVEEFKEFYTPSKQKEEFLVKEAISNTLSILSEELKKRNIKYKLNFLKDENIKIFGSKNELSQVILSLVSNASDALKDIENPFIEIEVDSTAADVIINIKDNGKGINKKFQEKIFEPYFTTKDEGTGLGLYLSKLIIEKSFNGKIEYKKQKEGSIFSLLFEKAI